MAANRLRIPRDKYLGLPIDPKTGKPIELPEPDHFYRCEACGALVDRRDLGQVYEHEGELPHPAGDKPQ